MKAARQLSQIIVGLAFMGVAISGCIRGSMQAMAGQMSIQSVQQWSVAALERYYAAEGMPFMAFQESKRFLGEPGGYLLTFVNSRSPDEMHIWAAWTQDGQNVNVAAINGEAQAVDAPVGRQLVYSNAGQFVTVQDIPAFIAKMRPK